MTVPPIYAGRTVYVCASGPSFDRERWPERLAGRAVVAVNLMLEALPRAGIVYFTDLRFWQWYRERIVAHPGLKFTCEQRVKHPDVSVLRKAGLIGLADDPGTVSHGNCSGFAAINVTAHAGARRIVLLGFDMRLGPRGEQHSHADHPVALKAEHFDKMLPWFATLTEPLTERGIEVVNATEGSAISCFPRMPAEQALALPD